MRVNPQVTSVISLVSAGLGLVGSVVSFFAVANSLPHLIAVIANSAFTVASGTATIGSEEMKRQIAELDHEMALIKKELGLDGIAIQTLSIEAQDLADDMYKNIDQCQMILAKREQIKRRMIALQLRG
jgi:hypothetical protein